MQNFILFLNYAELHLVVLGGGQWDSCIENCGAFAQAPIFSSPKFSCFIVSDPSTPTYS